MRWFVLSLILLTGLAQAQSLSEEEARHYLLRTRLSFSDEDLKQLRTTEYRSNLLADLEANRQESGLEAYLAKLRYQDLAPREIYLALLEEPKATTLVEEEMLRARILRGLLSENQLREVMTDFWFNHFNADPDKGEVVACNVPRLEQDLRRNAFGSFRQILGLAVRNPAVLENLDNTVSDGRAVNENFGREVVELYTTGPIHSQQEVVEVARCFSGWSYDSEPSSPTFLQFRYYSELHSKGPKTVFGQTFGDHQQEQVLDALARHPATAEFISKKLVTRFVSDDPPAALVERAAKRFQETDGEIEQVLEVILSSEEFFSAAHRGQKFKTPMEFVVSALANSDIDGSWLDELAEDGPQARLALDSLQVMGSPYSCPNPLGWPDKASVWTSPVGLRARWKLARALANANKQCEITLGSPEFQAR